MQGPSWRASRAILTIAIISASCGCNRPTEIPVVPARGTVTVNGKPAANVFLVFHPVTNKKDLRELAPYGWTDQEGRFALSTRGDADGAPVGEYVVTLEWPAPMDQASDDPEGMRSGPDMFRGAYALADQSPFQRTVTADNPELDQFVIE